MSLRVDFVTGEEIEGGDIQNENTGLFPPEDPLRPHYFRNRIVSGVLVLLTLSGFILGILANIQIHRSFGPYSVISLLALAVFLLGFIRLPRGTRGQYIATQVYFVCMWCVLIAAAIAGIVYLAQLKNKVTKYCADLPYGCTPEGIQHTFNVTLPLCIVSLVFFILCFTYFIRLVWKLIDAYQKQYMPEETPGLTRAINLVGPYLPNYTQLIKRCFRGLLNCCGRTTDCLADLQCCPKGGNCLAILVSSLCLCIGIFCIVVALLPETFGPGWQLFCVIWEIVIQIFFDSKKH